MESATNCPSVCPCLSLPLKNNVVSGNSPLEPSGLKMEGLGAKVLSGAYRRLLLEFPFA